MERNKKKKLQLRWYFKTLIVFLLVFSLAFQDSEVIFASVHDKVREFGIHLQQEQIKKSVNEIENSGSDIAEPDENNVSPSIPESEEVRLPEDFYPEVEEEIPGELVDVDDTSATYEQEDGSYITVFGDETGVYETEDGEFREIDNTLVVKTENYSVDTVSGSAVLYENAENNYVVQVPSIMNEEIGTTLIKGDYIMQCIPMDGDFSKSVALDNAIRYSDVYENIDYQYTLLDGSLKEDIVLLNPTDKNTFSYRLKIGDLKAKLKENAIWIYDTKEEEPIFLLEAPSMEDANGEMSFGIQLSLSKEEDSYIVTVTADKEWISSEERVYPIRIDPTSVTVKPSSFRMACVEEGSPNAIIGDNSYPYVGYDDGEVSGNYAGYKARHLNSRTYIRFTKDLQKIMKDGTVNKATFSIGQKTGWSKGKSTFYLCEVKEDWDPSTLTWNSQKKNHFTKIGEKKSVAKGKRISYNVTSLVAKWV